MTKLSQTKMILSCNYYCSDEQEIYRTLHSITVKVAAHAQFHVEKIQVCDDLPLIKTVKFKFNIMSLLQ